VDEGDLQYVAFKVGKLHLAKTKCLEVPEGSLKTRESQSSTGGSWQLGYMACQNCWLPAERNQLLHGSSVLESSFIGGHNQGLPKVPSLVESLGL
jgi:hypothetical protein